MELYKFLFLGFFLVSFSVISQSQTITHTVEKGESVYLIAKKYKVSEAAIFDLNPSIKNKPLQIKEKLQIPSNAISIKENETPLTHTVKSGDTFLAIAYKYNLKSEDLKILNQNLDINKLKIGDLIILKKEPVKVVEIPVQKNSDTVKNKLSVNTLTHIIKKGETKYSISKKYGVKVKDLETLNPGIKSRFPIGASLIIKTEDFTIENDVAETVNEKVSEETEEKEMSIIERLISNANNYVGTRYKLGGTTKKGLDCSGLMLNSFKQLDILLPRTSRNQAKVGSVIPKSEARKGDLIFFATNGGKTISHVGLITEIIGDEIKFIHASTSSGVIISSIKEPYYFRRFVQINRILLNN